MKIIRKGNFLGYLLKKLLKSLTDIVFIDIVKTCLNRLTVTGIASCNFSYPDQHKLSGFFSNYTLCISVQIGLMQAKAQFYDLLLEVEDFEHVIKRYIYVVYAQLIHIFRITRDVWFLIDGQRLENGDIQRKQIIFYKQKNIFPFLVFYSISSLCFFFQIFSGL